MGWKGIAFGSWIGSLFGGPLGALFGAVLGHQVEKKLFGLESVPRKTSSYRRASSRNRGMVFCASASAMLAKLAKADGRVSASEIAAVERAFARLGFSKVARDYAMNVFRKAKDDNHTIYEYATEFASVVESVEVRELFYELLWDLACADGPASRIELAILARIPRALRISSGWYELFARQHLQGESSSSSSRSRGGFAAPKDELAAAYVELGVASDSDDATVKKAYRDKAKKFHPDALKAQGLPDEMIGKATERMARINAAWSKVRAARGL